MYLQIWPLNSMTGKRAWADSLCLCHGTTICTNCWLANDDENTPCAPFASMKMTINVNKL